MKLAYSYFGAACLYWASALPFALAGTFTANFDDGQVPANSQVFGNAVVESTGGVNNSGTLKLTKAINSQSSSYIIDDLDAGATVYGFRMSMMARVGGGTQTPADGWSVNFAPDLPDSPMSETGGGSGLTIMFDTYDNVDANPNNSTGEAPQITVRVGGQTVAASGILPLSAMITGSQFAPAHITLNADGSLDLDFNGRVIFTNLFLPNYQPMAGGRFGFGARTGGANENCFIDDLSIRTLLTPEVGFVQQPRSQTVLEGSPAVFSIQLNNAEGATIQWLRNGTAIAGATDTTYATPAVRAEDHGAKFSVRINLGGTTVTSGEATLKVASVPLPATPVLSFNFNDGAVPPSAVMGGTAYISPSGGVSDSGHLVLTDAANDQSGIFLIDDPHAGAAVYGIAARFDLRMGGGTETPADGFSFNYATDLPDTGEGAEEGVGTGLSVTADVYDSGAGEAPSFSVKFGGAVVADFKVPRSAMQTGDDFVDILIRLTPDGLLDFAWNGWLLFERVPIPGFSSLAGGRIGLYARTGGLNQAHAVDNLRIYTYLTAEVVRITRQPEAQTALAGKPATFATEVNLAEGTTFQWFRNGAAIAGATQNSYSLTAPTVADQGARFKVEVKRGGQTLTSDEVELTVVDLAVPSNPQLSYDFNNGLPAGAEIAGTALIDTIGGINDSGVLKVTVAENSQSGGLRSGLVAGGAQLLEFTLAVDVLAGGGTEVPADGFSINLARDVTVGPPGEAENGGGSGLSFVFDTYDNADANPNDGTGEAPAIEIKYKGQVLVSKMVPLSLVNVPDAYFTVLIRVKQNGLVDLAYGDSVIYSGFQIPGYTPLDSVKVALYARTGGANANHWFDNLRLGATIPSAVAITREPSDTVVLLGQPANFSVAVSNPQGVTYQWSRNGTAIPGATQTTYSTPALTAADDGAGYSVQVNAPGNSLTSRIARARVVAPFEVGANPPINFNFNDGAVPVGSAVLGNAFVEEGVMKLTLNENGQSGAFLLEPLAGLTNISDFTATWRMRIGGGTDVPADGISFVLADDLSEAPFGEDGSGSGLIVSFDIYDNGQGEAPAIDVLYKGTVVASRKFEIAALRTGDALAPIGVRINRNGSLDLHYGNQVVFYALALPDFTPFAGESRFAWGARTGGLNENQWLDDVKISVNTQPPVVEAPKFVNIVRNANGAIIVTWTGGGTLQAAPDCTGPFQDVPGATSPYTLIPTSERLFGRIKK